MVVDNSPLNKTLGEQILFFIVCKKKEKKLFSAKPSAAW